MGITAKIPPILAPLPYGGGHPPTENVKGITLTKDQKQSQTLWICSKFSYYADIFADLDSF